MTPEAVHIIKLHEQWDADDARLEDSRRRQARGLNPPRPEYVQQVLSAVEDRASQKYLETQPIEPIVANEAAIAVQGIAIAPGERSHYAEAGDGQSIEQVDFTHFK